MIEDFCNFSPEKCKDLIIKYQQTNDEEIFALLLAKYDLYIVKNVSRLKKNYKHLQNEDIKELYHIGIIAFSNTLKKFNPNSNCNFIMIAIKRSIEKEIARYYKYKINEGIIPRYLDDDFVKKSSYKSLLFKYRESELGDFDKVSDKISFSIITSSHILSDHEKQLLELKFIQGKVSEDISKILDIPSSTIRYQIRGAITKLRKALKKSDVKNIKKFHINLI